MAKSFDSLVRRTTTRTVREKAAVRAQELFGVMLLSEIRKLTGKSQRQVASAAGMSQPSLSKLEKVARHANFHAAKNHRGAGRRT